MDAARTMRLRCARAVGAAIVLAGCIARAGGSHAPALRGAANTTAAQRQLQSNTASAHDVMTLVRADGRCTGKPNGDFGALGRQISLGQCKQACLDSTTCFFVAYQNSTKLCSEYTFCSSFAQAGKTLQTWAKEPANAITGQLSLADVMTCTSVPKPPLTTTCMTGGVYNDIFGRISKILDTLGQQPCTNDNCKKADFAGCVLRAAGHDFMDFRNGVGGSDGCLNFKDPDNRGLINCLRKGFQLEGDMDPDTFRSGATPAPTAAPVRVDSLYELYQDFCASVSLADFLVAAAESVMAATATSSTFDLKAAFKKNFKFGRTTKESCEDNTPLPNPKDGCNANEVTFLGKDAFQFSWRQTAALMGVHTLGKAHASNSGYSGWWTDEDSVAHFDNAYYVDIVNKGWSPSIVQSSNKSQWARSDAHQDDAFFEHPQMMLNTDMCLAFKDVLAESSNCCAWERFGVLADAGVQDELVQGELSRPIFCGFPTPFPGFIPERGWCCDNQGRQNAALIPIQQDDCVPNLQNGGKASGPAINDVLEFAAKEDVWLAEFTSTWMLATEMGTRNLKSVQGQNDCAPVVTMVKARNDGRCKGAPSKSWGNLGKRISLDQCKQACIDSTTCVFAVFQWSTGKCTEYEKCNRFVKQGKTFQTWGKSQPFAESPFTATATSVRVSQLIQSAQESEPDEVSLKKAFRDALEEEGQTVEMDDIETMVQFKIEQSFTFTGVDVMDIVARSAAAKAFEVAEDNVTVEITYTRRLSGTTVGERRLAGSDVNVAIKLGKPTRADAVKAKCSITPAIAQSFAQAYATSQREVALSEITAPMVTAKAPSMEMEIDFSMNGASEIKAEKPETFAAARKVVDRETFEKKTPVTEQPPTTTAALNPIPQTPLTKNESKTLEAATDTAIQTRVETIATAGESLTTSTSTSEEVQAPTTTSAASSTAPVTATATASYDSVELSGACALVSVVAWLLPIFMCAAASGEA